MATGTRSRRGDTRPATTVPGDTEEVKVYKEHLREVALKVKRNQGWCDEGFNDVAAELGIRGTVDLVAFTGIVKLTPSEASQETVGGKTEQVLRDEITANLAQFKTNGQIGVGSSVELIDLTITTRSRTTVETNAAGEQIGEPVVETTTRPVASFQVTTGAKDMGYGSRLPGEDILRGNGRDYLRRTLNPFSDRYSVSNSHTRWANGVVNEAEITWAIK